MQGIDLHTHSNISDGTLSPELLVQAAVDVKLHTLALTDHDTMEMLHNPMISGVEISSQWSRPSTKKLWRAYCSFKYAR